MVYTDTFTHSLCSPKQGLCLGEHSPEGQKKTLEGIYYNRSGMWTLSQWECAWHIGNP